MIFSDLKTAETDLKYTERFGGGRPYPASASALLARVYLTYAAEHHSQEHYQLAVDKAKSVIPNFPMLENYGDLFKVANRFNTEIIWGVNFSATLSEGWKGAQFLVRLLPALDGVSNAQGWENATEDLWNSFDQQNDQRLDVTLKRSFTYSDGSIKDFDKPYVFKYWDSQAEPKGNNTEAIFPAIRTAEMYLIIAEALNEINQGANEEAVIAINAVRNRAGLTTAVPTDYKGFKKAVLNEYRHEFVMEGHRWFDLRRYAVNSIHPLPDNFTIRHRNNAYEANSRTWYENGYYELNAYTQDRAAWIIPIPNYAIEFNRGELQNEIRPNRELQRD